MDAWTCAALTVWLIVGLVVILGTDRPKGRVATWAVVLAFLPSFVLMTVLVSVLVTVGEIISSNRPGA
jgi:chromate transport protein ChrA